MNKELKSQLERFSKERCSWLATTRPDGRPHTVPIWHVWHDFKVFFVTKGSSWKVRNIRHNPMVTLSLPDPMEVFILEGRAQLSPERLDELQPIFAEKYDWNIRTDGDYDTIVEVKPLKIWGWGSEGKFRWTGSDQGSRNVVQ